MRSQIIFKTIIHCAIYIFLAMAAPLRAEDNHLNAIEDYLSQFKKEIPVPGFSVAIVRNGKIIFTRGYGVERIGGTKRMTPQTSLGIGSVTKSFTALAIMQLVDEGKIGLDDPVIKYLPWFKTADRDESRKITVRMLLTNTSGLSSIDSWNYIGDINEDAIERGVRALSNYRLNRKPGQAFEYSNEGWNVLGVIISKVSGMTYSKYLEKRIFKPLGMARSSTNYKRLREIGVIQGHFSGIDSFMPAPLIFEAGGLPAGSGLSSCAEDMGRYLIALLRRGVFRDTKIVSAKSVDEMFIPRARMPLFKGGEMPIPDDMTIPETSYANGWIVSDFEGRRLIHHGGDTITMSSYIMLCPEKDMGVVLLFNTGSYDLYRFKAPFVVCNNLLHIMAGEMMRALPFAKRNIDIDTKRIPKHVDLKSYSGTYVSDKGVQVDIKKDEKNRLVAVVLLGSFRIFSEIVLQGNSGFIMRCLRMYLHGNFIMAADGRVLGLNIGGASYGGAFRRKADSKLAGFTELLSPGKNFRGFTPKGWRHVWVDGKTLIVNNTRNVFMTYYFTVQGDYESFIKSHPIEGKTVATSEFFESVAGHSWKESVVRYRKGDEMYQRVVFFCVSKRQAVVVNGSQRDITLTILKTIVPMLANL